jgi:hypothetical protein
VIGGECVCKCEQPFTGLRCDIITITDDDLVVETYLTLPNGTLVPIIITFPQGGDRIVKFKQYFDQDYVAPVIDPYSTAPFGLFFTGVSFMIELYQSDGETPIVSTQYSITIELGHFFDEADRQLWINDLPNWVAAETTCSDHVKTDEDGNLYVESCSFGQYSIFARTLTTGTTG